MVTATSPKAPRRAGAASPAFYNVETYRVNDSVAYLMKRLIQSFSTEVQHELDPSGLTNAQWVPLFKLHLGHGATAAELARECQLDAGAMTRTLDRLEAKGLVRRVRSSEDRRVVNLELSDEGRKTAGEIPKVLCGVLNAHLQGFAAEEVEQLKSLLQRMLDNGEALQKRRNEQA